MGRTWKHWVSSKAWERYPFSIIGTLAAPASCQCHRLSGSINPMRGLQQDKWALLCEGIKPPDLLELMSKSRIMLSIISMIVFSIMVNQQRKSCNFFFAKYYPRIISMYCGICRHRCTASGVIICLLEHSAGACRLALCSYGHLWCKHTSETLWKLSIPSDLLHSAVIAISWKNRWIALHKAGVCHVSQMTHLVADTS